MRGAARETRVPGDDWKAAGWIRPSSHYLNPFFPVTPEQSRWLVHLKRTVLASPNTIGGSFITVIPAGFRLFAPSRTVLVPPTQVIDVCETYGLFYEFSVKCVPGLELLFFPVVGFVFLSWVLGSFHHPCLSPEVSYWVFPVLIWKFLLPRNFSSVTFPPFVFVFTKSLYI